MKIFALKTAGNESELTILDDHNVLSKKVWDSGRDLARDLPKFIDDFLSNNKISKVDGYIGFLGPGSFTSLRIGISALNTLAYAYNLPIVGTDGDDWIASGVSKLLSGNNDKVLVPKYGAEANITLPKK